MRENQDDVKCFNMYLRELEGIFSCGEEEQDALIKKVVLGDTEARNRLVEGNLYRAMEIAGEFAKSGVSAADLVSEANLALTMAVEQYANDHMPAPTLFVQSDPLRGGTASGADFTVFMEQYVKACLEDYTEEEKQTDLASEKIASLMNLMDEVTLRLAKEYEREATLEEIAGAMKMEPEEVKVLMKMALEAASASVPEETEETLYVDENDGIVETERETEEL